MTALNILFIGNSYTHCNCMPEMLDDLSKSTDTRITSKQVAPGGATFEDHCTSETSLAALAESDWDYVVLQEQSLRPILEPDKMMNAAIELSTKIRDIGSEPLMYLTWPRKHKPELQNTLTQTYTTVARQIHAKIAPVGLAWKNALAANPALEFYVADNHHPSMLGSYVAACVFYATFSRQSPVGLPHTFTLPDGTTDAVPPDDALVIQNAAWKAYQELDSELR